MICAGGNMKKILFFGMAILLISIVGLSGCNEIGNQFEGTWDGSLEMPSMFVGMSISELTFSGNNVYMTFGAYGADNTVSGTYTTEGNKLLMTFPTGYALTYTYEFKGGYLYLDGSKFTKT